MACVLINRSSRATLDEKVADEVWTDSMVDFSSLKVIGYSAYVPVSREGSKLDAKFG